MKIGKKIKQLRLEREFTQAELARKSRLHRVGLAKIESGQRKTPDLATCRKLAKALDVKITFLWEGKMDAKKQDAETKWNEEVNGKAKILESLLPWLKKIEKDEDNTAWDQRVSAGRAWHQIEMAILDIYSLQFPDKKEVRLSRES